VSAIDVRQSTLGTADEKGTGLGLLISKDFVEKNGGKIWAVSEKGKGTTFCFTIQKYPGSQNEEKKSTPEDVGNLI
ncbi:MAG: cell wall metabolism sensor histidine kinase WalK, partial [Bacteroidetes bacterium]|nr:cell wall metabolism sensor histidine kinase WalK [Bacteroidota bacterium]